MNRWAAHMRWIPAAVVSVAVGAACGNSAGTSNADKVGNERGPIRLTLATSEGDGGAAAAVVEAFVHAVDQASGGRVVIEPHFGLHFDELQWDQKVISDVADGDFDLVLARAGSWHTLGVTTLDALELPGVIESDQQADRVVADDSLVERLLAGVESLRMTGLGLYPDAPRYLESLDDTTSFAPSDLRGRIIRAPLSETVFDVLQAVGMTPVDMSFKDFATQVSEGNITMTENPMSRIVGTSSVDGGPTVVADNFTLYTKFLVLAAASDSLAKLGDNDAALIIRAASDSIDVFSGSRQPEMSWIDKVCEQGHVLVDIGANDRAALLEAMSPVVDAVADGPSGDLVGAVQRAAGVPGSHDLSCPNRTVPDTTAVHSQAEDDAPGVTLPTKRSEISAITGDLPNGVYRFTETLEILQAVEPNLEHTKADEFIGEYVLKDGTVELRFYDLDGRSLGPPDRGGAYQVVGDLIIFAQPPNRSLPGTNGIHLLRWSMKGDTLTLEQVDDKRRDPDFVAPMIRVGDAP